MKKLYFLLSFLIAGMSFGQGSIDFDTDLNWSPAPLGYGNYTYTDGSFTATGVDVFRNGSGVQDGFPGALGTYSVRIRNNTTTSLTMIIATGGVGTFSFQARRWDGSPATNFVVETTTDNGANWTASSVIDATVTTDSDWKTINGAINSANPNVGVRIISGGTTERLMVDDFSWTGSTTACGLTLGATAYICDSNTVGDNNDSVTINIPYTGLDVGITSVSTTAVGATIGGDDPATVANGTITLSGLGESDAWDITLNGGDCDGISTSGTVPAAECDPIPNTCFDLSSGANNFELVTVTPNSQMDEWTLTAGAYDMNGFCGGGCVEAIETWMVFGPLDMTGVTDLALSFDAAESFGVTDLNFVYTSAYSGCPSSTTWTTAQTIAMAGSYDIDLAMAMGTDVYIGVQYLDDGVDGYSGWTLTNVTLDAFGACPTLGTVVPSNCAVCDITLQTENYVCGTNTTGANNDQVTIEIPYTGVEGTITSITTTSMGAIAGDDPALIMDGTITITGLGEGDAWDLTINGGDCDATTISGTVAGTQCDPTFLIINEINADPSNNINGEGDANGDGTVDSNEDEFLEIYNTSTSPIDMSNYVISDASADRHVFPTGTILSGESFITVFGGGTPTGISGLTQISSTGVLSLNNGGDTITLKNDIGITVTQEVYTGAGNNQSIARDPDFTGPFVQHSAIIANPVLFSPGENNDGSTLSVNQFDATGFNIYPNPTNTGFVNITTVSNETVNVAVFDILGKQVIKTIVNNERLDVSNLNTGVYILKLSQNGASTTKKLVVK